MHFFQGFIFIVLFTQVYRHRPHQYLACKGMDKTKDLLAENKLVKEVYNEVGFEGGGTFSVLFKKEIGFKVHTDDNMDNGFRSLTFTTPEVPDHELVLFPATANATGFDQDVKDAMKRLLEKGVMGAGVLQTNDCLATYEELKVKGVQF